MKKVLIVLLSLLIAFSFISCEKDKSEEIISTLQEYKRGSKLTRGAIWAFGDFIDGKDGEKTITEEDNTDSNCVGSMIEVIKDISYAKVVKSTAKSGTITTKIESDEKTRTRIVTIKDAVIEAEYIDYYTDEEKKETITLEVDGTYTFVWNNETETYDYTYSFTVNGITYEITETRKDGKYTAASVNGKSVDVRLLNN